MAAAQLDQTSLSPSSRHSVCFRGDVKGREKRRRTGLLIGQKDREAVRRCATGALGWEGCALACSEPRMGRYFLILKK